MLAVVQNHLQLQFLTKVANQNTLQKIEKCPQHKQQQNTNGQAAQHLTIATYQDIIGENLHQQWHSQSQHTDGQIQHQGLKE